MSEGIEKQDPTMCCLQETHFKYKDPCKLKVVKRRKTYYANTNQKKAGVAIVTSDREDFRARDSIRNKEGHYINVSRVSSQRKYGNS